MYIDMQLQIKYSLSRYQSIMLSFSGTHLAAIMVERGSGRMLTRKRETTGLNPPFATVSKFWHFQSLHDASVYSAVL